MDRNRRVIQLRRRQHECEVVHERRQDFVPCSFERRWLPPAPMIGHTELVLAAVLEGEARAVPGAILILGVDAEVLPVDAHAQMRKPLGVQGTVSLCSL